MEIIAGFWKPIYLKPNFGRSEAYDINFTSDISIIISRVFVWHVVTFIGSFILAYALFFIVNLIIVNSTDSGNESLNNMSNRYGWVIRKGGYSLRNKPVRTLIGPNIVKVDTIKNKKLKPLPSGTKVAILGKTKDENWYKVEYRSDKEGQTYTGYIAEKVIIEERRAENLVKKFLDTIAISNESKLWACQQLVEWQGNCGDLISSKFLDSPLYGGIDSISRTSRRLSINEWKNKLVLNVKYTAIYDWQSFLDIPGSLSCRINFINRGDIQGNLEKDNFVGFEYNENFLIIKQKDSKLKIWGHIPAKKNCFVKSTKPNRFEQTNKIEIKPVY